VVLDKAFETGLRFNFNIVHNFEQIKQKLNKKANNDIISKPKNSLTLPKIETRKLYLTKTENNNNFDYKSNDTQGENLITAPNIIRINKKENCSEAFGYEITNFKNTIIHSNELNNNKTQTSEKFFMNNELKTEYSHLATEEQDSLKTPKKEFSSLNRLRFSHTRKDSEDFKSNIDIDKDLIDKAHNAYQSLKSETLLKSITKKKSSNLIINDLIYRSEIDENNIQSHQDRFLKMKKPIPPTNEENNVVENDHKNKNEDIEAENGFFDFGLKKPKRKIQINIFTEKNKDNEELKVFEQLILKLNNNNNEDETRKKTMDQTQELKDKVKDKKDIWKTSPLKHPLVFPEFNKYGLFSGFKKQEMKKKYGYTVLKNNQFHKNRNVDLNNNIHMNFDDKSNRNINNFMRTSQEDIKEKSASSSSPKNENDKKSKKRKLPKIKEQLQFIYKVNPDIIKSIKSLKNETSLSLDEYQLKLMGVAKRILSDENLKNLANRFKEIAKITLMKEKVKSHNKSINRWEIMVNSISRYIPEFLVEKMKSQK